MSSSLQPLLLLPSISLSIRVFSNELALHIRWPKYWSFGFSISPSSEYSELVIATRMAIIKKTITNGDKDMKNWEPSFLASEKVKCVDFSEEFDSS